MAPRESLMRQHMTYIEASSRKSNGWWTTGLLVGALLASGCAQKAALSGEGPSGEFGTVVLALKNIPVDVQCVRLTVAGNSTVVRTFPVTPNDQDPDPVTMGGLPLGNATVYEDTFDSPCDSVGPTSNPTWVAQAPVPVNLTPGAQVSVTIVLRRPGGLSVGMDYQTGGLSVTPPAADFGSVPVSTTSNPITFVVGNSTTTAASLTITIAGADAGSWVVTGNTCGLPVAAGATCSFQLGFLPSSLGTKNATAVVSSATAGSVSVALTGMGVPLPLLSLQPTMADFGSVAVGGTVDRTFTVTNIGGAPTGTPSTFLAGANAADYSFVQNNCNAPLAPGAACTQVLRFQPTTGGSKAATLNLNAAPGGAAVAQLTGNGISPASLTINPASHDYGDVIIDTASAPFTFIVANPGGTATAPLNVTLIPGFTLQPSTCMGATLAPGATCTVVVAFTPTLPLGAKAGTVTVTAGGVGGMVTANLQGNAVLASLITLSPGAANFGSVRLGNRSSSLAFTVSNPINRPTTPPLLTAVTGAEASAFQIVANACSGVALAPGASCTMSLEFAPIMLGTHNAVLNVSTGMIGVSAVLTGTGIPPAGLQLMPSTISYGNVPVGQSVSQTLTLVNFTGFPASSLAITLSGTDASQFQLSSNNCIGTLANGASCTFAVSFAPGSLGAKTASAAASSASTPTVSASLSGNGIGTIFGLNPTSLAFNNIPVGSLSAKQTVTLTNNGAAASGTPSVVVGGVDAAHYQLLNNTCLVPLAIGASCTFDVRFFPTTLNTKTAAVTAISASAPAVSASLTGTVSDWSHQDVGTVGSATGSWSQAGGIHTIRGAGADIWGTNDAFQYVFRNVSGNATITARVNSIQLTDQWSKAAVMMRATTASNSPYVAALVPGLASNLYRQQYRTGLNGGDTESKSTGAGNTGAPGAWVRVTRVGNTFSTFFSTNGASFTPLGAPVMVDMPANITLGLAVTSHAPGTLATGVFEQVSITTP